MCSVGARFAWTRSLEIVHCLCVCVCVCVPRSWWRTSTMTTKSWWCKVKFFSGNKNNDVDILHNRLILKYHHVSYRKERVTLCFCRDLIWAGKDRLAVSKLLPNIFQYSKSSKTKRNLLINPPSAPVMLLWALHFCSQPLLNPRTAEGFSALSEPILLKTPHLSFPVWVKAALWKPYFGLDWQAVTGHYHHCTLVQSRAGPVAATPSGCILPWHTYFQWRWLMLTIRQVS